MSITEHELAVVFRARVDDEADALLSAHPGPLTLPVPEPDPAGAAPAADLAGPVPVRPLPVGPVPVRPVRVRRSAPGAPGLPGLTGPWRVVALAAAAALVVAGAAAVLVGRSGDVRPQPAAPEPEPTWTVGAWTMHTDGGMEALRVAHLQVVDGCLAVGPRTLLVVDPSSWLWQDGVLLHRGTGRTFELGDTFLLGGGEAPAAQSRAAQRDVPASCADFDGGLWSPSDPQAGPAIVDGSGTLPVAALDTSGLRVEPVDGLPAGPAVEGRLMVVDGCLAVAPDVLLGVDHGWLWDGATGALTWVPSAQSEPLRLGDAVRVEGMRVPAARVRAEGGTLPASCAGFTGDVLLATGAHPAASAG
ncbi:hypothetical protein ACT17Q_03330 [Cellulomonas sp. CW35]|uniref:hypothetical protein n=1 Tax=Cellulomonas sp. CW35 TaxID=3458249 RepID=UPI00403422B6